MQSTTSIPIIGGLALGEDARDPVDLSGGTLVASSNTSSTQLALYPAGCAMCWVLGKCRVFGLVGLASRSGCGWCVRCDDGWVWLSQFCSLMYNDDSSLQPYKIEYRT